jgi:hypothetical protein
MTAGESGGFFEWYGIPAFLKRSGFRATSEKFVPGSTVSGLARLRQLTRGVVRHGASARSLRPGAIVQQFLQLLLPHRGKSKGNGVEL